jgi:hypothetical protein
MSEFDEIGTRPKQARRSRLFRSRPDALLVDEWVPNITLPPPPDTPLLEDDPAELQLDEHGLPELPEEPEEEPEPAGPARLFVGMGQRGASVAPPPESQDDDEYVYEEPDDFFVAELRLPRPEDSLPFRIGSLGSDDEDELEEEALMLDAAESSDPDLAYPELDAPFTVSLEPPDPVHLGSFGGDDEEDEQAAPDETEEVPFEGEELSGELDSQGELDDLVSGGMPPLTLQPSPARVPLSSHVGGRRSVEVSKTPVSRPAPPVRSSEDEPSSPVVEPTDGVPSWATPTLSKATGKPVPPPEAPQAQPGQSGKSQVLLRSRPFWHRDRRLPEPKPASAPVFNPRAAPEPPPIREKLFSWQVMGPLLAILALALGGLLWQYCG